MILLFEAKQAVGRKREIEVASSNEGWKVEGKFILAYMMIIQQW